ncbi:response regulator transcription factor [Polluticaenibacter yanchengensis]|uniref:Response regulator transcription factor n=1 Tax=Polluticaenibacter yanchengensis TaxID=3014562 RepID=A0ABT4UFP0_9BACT|nr:response regulator transcription factor [Chitinophagaceae bacterium LY-5]
MEKVLLIEDEAALAEIIKESLEDKGFQVFHALTLANATRICNQHQPHIIVTDVMMPDGSGFDWVQQVRLSNTQTPVIFLTALSQTSDVVKGFDLGGNDYLKKPFSIAELIVRVKALLNRNISTQSKPSAEHYKWKIGQFSFSYPGGGLSTADSSRQLTSREADILYYLLLKKNEQLNRNDLLLSIWGNTDYFSGRSLDVFISKLRRYFKPDPSIKIINVRGIGYKLIF